MFTGLVEALGIVSVLEDDRGGGKDLTLECPKFASTLAIGESVAVNGVCLTVVASASSTVRFQVGPETLSKTNLGQLSRADRVNLERSLRLGDRLGGHFVQGHVDGVGVIVERRTEGEWEHVRFHCPAEWTPLLVERCSIAVDGVSLTVVTVSADDFCVMLIPHTLAETTLGFKPIGAKVNLETDMLARHVRKLLGKG